MGALCRKVFESSIASLIRLDTRMAEDAIAKNKEAVQLEEKLSGEILSPRTTGEQVASVKLILESIRRVGEYGADIAEIAIDLTVKEPQLV
jgi:hypothetical protein